MWDYQVPLNAVWDSQVMLCVGLLGLLCVLCGTDGVTVCGMISAPQCSVSDVSNTLCSAWDCWCHFVSFMGLLCPLVLCVELLAVHFSVSVTLRLMAEKSTFAGCR